MADLTLGEAIYYLLANDSTVKGLVGTKIFPMRASQKTALPYITYNQVGESPVHASGADAGLENPGLQVSCFAETFAEVNTLVAAVKSVLRDYSGTVGSGDTLVIQGIWFENRVDLQDVDPETKTTSYHTALDFEVWHE